MKILVHIVSIGILVSSVFTSFILRLQNIDMTEWRFGLTYWYLGIIILASLITAGLTSEADGRH